MSEKKTLEMNWKINSIKFCDREIGYYSDIIAVIKVLLFKHWFYFMAKNHRLAVLNTILVPKIGRISAVDSVRYSLFRCTVCLLSHKYKRKVPENDAVHIRWNEKKVSLKVKR